MSVHWGFSCLLTSVHFYHMLAFSLMFVLLLVCVCVCIVGNAYIYTVFNVSVWSCVQWKEWADRKKALLSSWVWCGGSWLHCLPLVVFFQPLQLSLSFQSPLGFCFHLLSLQLHLLLSLLQLGFSIQELLVPWDRKHNIQSEPKEKNTSSVWQEEPLSIL